MELPAAQLSLETLPLECLVEIFSHLAPADLASVMRVSAGMNAAASEDCLWRGLCVRGQHGHCLEFKESLGCFCHPDARPLTSDAAAAPPRERAHSTASAGWREVFRLSTDSLRKTICLDVGRGYAKYGMANGTPQMIQICQPNAEASQQTLFPTAFRRLNLRREELRDCALIVAEPFRLASSARAREREEWRAEIERRALRCFELKRLAIVDSASLCLFANKLTSGVVVNIGFAMTFVVPVIGGHIVREAVRTMQIGGAALTQVYQQVLEVSNVDLSSDNLPEITVARNLKELSCEVFPVRLASHFGHSPFQLQSLRARTDAPLLEVSTEGRAFTLGWERFLPAEMLFEEEGGLTRQVVEAVDTAAAKAAADGGADEATLRSELLGRVVLSGGSSLMPGLDARLQAEVGAAVVARGGLARGVKVYPSQGGDLTTWRGASVLAGTSTFAEHWCVHAPTDRAARLEEEFGSEEEEMHSDTDLSMDEDEEDEDEEDEDEMKEEEGSEEEGEEEDSEEDGEQEEGGEAGPCAAPTEYVGPLAAHVAGTSSNVAAVPPRPPHRGVDYSKWDHIVDSDDED